MAFKMKGFPKKTEYLEDKTNPKDQKYPGNNNPGTPDVLYTAAGEAVSTSQIDEGELGASTKTDSNGKYAQHSNGTKYYFNKPK